LSQDLEGIENLSRFRILLTASENMMEDFGGQNGTGGNGTGDWFNQNGDSYQNGYWSLFDMVDLAAGANGTWDLFG
jgi:hypothetical protein